jgi:hypothetical protein
VMTGESLIPPDQAAALAAATGTTTRGV